MPQPGLLSGAPAGGGMRDVPPGEAGGRRLPPSRGPSVTLITSKPS